jgi:ElaB/YqjD/DUF883 family membrane-anchored ribosome-binding protein
MDNAVNTLAKQGQGLADNAADKVQDAAPGVRNAAARAQAMGKQGLDAVSKAAGCARDVASSTSQSIITYTKENPVKALIIAAVSGAVLITLSKAIKASRD